MSDPFAGIRRVDGCAVIGKGADPDFDAVQTAVRVNDVTYLPCQDMALIGSDYGNGMFLMTLGTTGLCLHLSPAALHKLGEGMQRLSQHLRDQAAFTAADELKRIAATGAGDAA